MTSSLATAMHGSFALGDDRALNAALSAFCASLDGPPALLGLGEPTHKEPAIAYLRNRILPLLAERGFRSIALESDLIAALTVDAYVRDGHGTLDQAMAEGFSHDFGLLDANRELVAWMREYNDGRPEDERLAFHGFDAPMETMSAPSPRRYLLHLHGYLAEHLGAGAFLHGRDDLDRLLGRDERWSATAAVLDPATSVGASPEARELRAVTDDLLITLRAHAPHLLPAAPDRWHLAEMHGRAALGLLRYHSQLAEPIEPGRRVSRLSAVRDTLMVENLLDVRARERDRGPTLVFSHNLHLKRNRSAMRMGDLDVEWVGAGAILSTLFGDRYAFIAGSLGASTALDLPAPPADTYEHALQQATRESALFDPARLRDALGDRRPRADTVPEQGYFPLEPAMFDVCDAVLHVAG